MSSVVPSEPEPVVRVSATGKGVKSLESGSLSLVFHVNPEESAEALKLHAFSGRPLVLEIYAS